LSVRDCCAYRRRTARSGCPAGLFPHLFSLSHCKKTVVFSAGPRAVDRHIFPCKTSIGSAIIPRLRLATVRLGARHALPAYVHWVWKRSCRKMGRAFSVGTVSERKFSQKIHSDNFHVELLSLLHLLNTCLLATVRICETEAGAGGSLRRGKQVATAGSGRRWISWVIRSVY
jgi:hypothetical protein